MSAGLGVGWPPRGSVEAGSARVHGGSPFQCARPGGGGGGPLGAVPGEGATWEARFGVWAAQCDTFWGETEPRWSERRA